MRISNCLHPQKVWNKYLKEYVYVPCGHCDACRNIHSHGWIVRLQQECRLHKYSLFFTLTYDDDCIPTFIKCSDGLVERKRIVRFRAYRPDKGYYIIQKSEYCGNFIPISEIDLSNPKDNDYYNRYEFFYSPSVSDVQKFIKRLRSKIHEYIKKVSSQETCGKAVNSDERVRYYIISEYGSLNFRPHYHGLLWFDNEVLASKIEQFIRDSWLNCSSAGIDTQFADVNTCSYVAKYLNCFSDLPSVYRHPETKPFALCSKRPFIGHDFYSREKITEILYNSTVQVPVFDGKTKKYVITRNPRSFEDRYVPKCWRFGSFPDSVRDTLYRFCEWSCIREIENVNDLKIRFHSCNDTYNRLLLEKLLDEFIVSHYYPDEYVEYYEKLLLSIYRTSKKVLKRSYELGISLDRYIKLIFAYWNRVEILRLKEFYEFQESFDGDSVELSLLYPLSCDNYYIDLQNSSDYIEMKSMNNKIAKDMKDNKSRKSFYRMKRYGLNSRYYE